MSDEKVNIYQRIWNADIECGNGLKPFLKSAGHQDDAKGSVLVNEADNREERNGPLLEMKLPESKDHTYKLFRRLLDNFAVAEYLDEDQYENGRWVSGNRDNIETAEFLAAVVDSKPMRVAREHLAVASDLPDTPGFWEQRLKEIWFKPYSAGDYIEATGFEHVFMGEVKFKKGRLHGVGGYHFWYKYWLDDSGANEAFPENEILFRAPAYKTQAEEGKKNPDCVTAEFTWKTVYLYETGTWAELRKRIGGFFVGPSPEGLMALVTTSWELRRYGKKLRGGWKVPCNINAQQYDLTIFEGDRGRTLRTHYPDYRGPVDPGTTLGSKPPFSLGPSQPQERKATGTVLITGLLPNPQGPDPGKETITLKNQTGQKISLKGWRLLVKDEVRSVFGETDVLNAKGEKTIVLPSENGGVLSNNGALVKLVEANGALSDAKAYSGNQVRPGEPITFK